MHTTTVHLSGEDTPAGAVRTIDGDHYGLVRIDEAVSIHTGDPEAFLALARTCRDVAIQLQAAKERRNGLPVYTPTGPVVGGYEVTTGRLACCGAGPDRQGEHLPGCSRVAAAWIAECRRVLDPEHDITPGDVRDAAIDAGLWDGNV